MTNPSRLLVVLAALLGGSLSGCGSASQVATPSVVPGTASVHSLAPGKSAQATPSSTSVRVVQLPSTYREHRISSDGPRVVLDEIGTADDSLASSIVFVDLARGTWRSLATAADGYHPWSPQIRGDAVAWVEWRYAAQPATGPCDWRIVVLSLATGKTNIVATGRNTRLEGLGAPPPPIALDGGELVYAEQDPSTARPWGWLVKVLDLASGRVVRTIATQQETYSLALSNGVVAYSEGLVDEGRGFVYKTRLMVSTPLAPAPREIASDAFEISFRDGRLAWVADIAASEQQSGLERMPRVWTTTSPSWVPVPVTADLPTATTRQFWPAAALPGVSFDQADSNDGSGGVVTLWDWNAATTRVESVPGSAGAILSSVDRTWIVWAGAVGDSVSVAGLPLSELPPG